MRFGPAEYAELLGLYLGDGHVVRAGRTHRLRLSLDARHRARDVLRRVDAAHRRAREPEAAADLAVVETGGGELADRGVDLGRVHEHMFASTSDRTATFNSMPSTASAPLRVAIVGAGPAGLYAAEKLLKAPDLDVEVAVLDRAATPWGLVRAGVAPDHPNIKAVTRVFEKTAALPGFSFHGNVEVGRDVSHEDLANHFHAVLYAFGAAGDRRLGIPGEDLPGSVAATDVVGWYNGDPDRADLDLDLDVERVVVIGNGNVALDVARMLVLTREELAVTDVADHALEALAASPVTEVVVLGRRGPAQAAWTTPELRELGELTDADVVVAPFDAPLDTDDKQVRRNVEVVQDYAQREPSGKRRRVVLRFCTSPVEVLGTDRVEGVRVVRTEVVLEPDGALRAMPTDEEEVIPCGLVVRSVGYRGRPIDGLPFDERRATLPNEAGRIEPGVYCAGWIKRGPSGVIGTNKKDAVETVATLLADHAAGALPEPSGDAAAFRALLDEQAPEHIDFAGWQRIDEHERGLGEPHGRPRVKLVRTPELLERAREGAPTPS